MNVFISGFGKGENRINVNAKCEHVESIQLVSLIFG